MRKNKIKKKIVRSFDHLCWVCTCSPNPALPDWKANVLIGENFQKRHLAIKRQGTTVHVTAQKTTESVQLGRKQLTREWLEHVKDSKGTFRSIEHCIILPFKSSHNKTK